MGTVPARRRALEWPRTLPNVTFPYVLLTNKILFKRKLLGEESLNHSIPMFFRETIGLVITLFSAFPTYLKIEVLLLIVRGGTLLHFAWRSGAGRIMFLGWFLVCPIPPCVFKIFASGELVMELTWGKFGKAHT